MDRPKQPRLSENRETARNIGFIMGCIERVVAGEPIGPSEQKMLSELGEPIIEFFIGIYEDRGAKPAPPPETNLILERLRGITQ